MQYCVYKITNLNNSKTYIGAHITSNLQDDYLGSGKLIKLAIKKYGRDSFIKEILFIGDNEAEMFKQEKELIFTTKPEYNLHEGGNGGWSLVNDMNRKNGFPMNARNSGYARLTKERRSAAGKKGVKTLIEFNRSGGYNPRRTGKKNSAEHNRKIGLANSINQKGSKNSQYGRPRSEETKRKISQALLARRKIRK